MATLSEAVTTIINTDITNGGAGSLQILLKYNAQSKPNCFFFMHPPEQPAFPLLTYSIVAQDDFFPRNIFYAFTAWGINFDAVLNRLFALLHKKTGVIPTDYAVRGIFYNGSGPVLWSEDWQTYFRQDRYRIVAVKI